MKEINMRSVFHYCYFALAVLLFPCFAPAETIVWHEVTEPGFQVQGFYWFQQEKLFRRLPQKLDPPVNELATRLANNTAGGQIRFQSDTAEVHIQADLYVIHEMDHMAPRGANGFDLYAGVPFHERFVTSGGPGSEARKIKTQGPEQQAPVQCQLYPWSEGEDAPRRMRSFVINLPLYNQVKTLKIGLSKDAKILPPPEYADARPIIVYGTSITQGCSASRPGNAITNILNRHLARPVYNFGFSASGPGEVPMITHLAKIENPALLIFDCEANAGAHTAKNVSACIKEYRKTHPSVPILWISGAPYSFETLDSRRNIPGELRNERWGGYVAAQKKAVKALQDAGDANLYFLDGAQAWKRSESDEMTIDGAHYNDHGFYLAAGHWEKKIREILNAEKNNARQLTGR